MTLDLKSFTHTIGQLENALEYYHSDLTKADPTLAPHLRAVAIQAFEFTYELSLKMLKRQLEQIESSEAAVHGITFDELIRRG